MSERRMFAKTIIDSDAFLDMPLSAQALYFHLSMRADDDGFINNPKKIQRVVGGSEDDLKLLIAKNFIIPFESGVVVIKHWRIHNYIRRDRYSETTYTEEKALLSIKDNGAYTFGELPAIEDKKPVKHKYGEYKNVLLTDEELEKLRAEFPDYERRIDDLSNYISSKGAAYKSHYATIRSWARRDKSTKTKTAEMLDASYNMIAEWGSEE